MGGELRLSRIGALIESDAFGRILLAVFAIGIATSISLAQSALALLAVRWLWRLSGRSRVARTWPLAAPFLAWIGTSLLAALVSARPLESLLEAKDLLLIATFYVILDGCREARDADRVLGVLIAAITAASVLGILQVTLCGPGNVATLLPTRLGRKCLGARGLYSITMTFGGALSLVLLATLPRLLLPISRRRWWPIPLWLVSFLTLAITRVRGAWLGFLAGILVQAGLLRRRGAALIGAIGVLAAASLLVPLVRERAATMADLNFDSTVDRLQMWTAGLAILRDHPIVGVGPGQVKRVFPEYSVPDAIRSHTGHVHSTPLQILIERGVLGFVAWGAIFVGFLARALRVLRELPPEAEPERALVIGSIGSIAGFLVGGLTEYNFGDSEVVMIAYCVMAMPFVVDAASRVATKAGSRRGGEARRVSE